MIGAIVSGADGEPVDGNGNKLSASAYQPSEEVKKLFAQVQRDYQVAYTLQHREFDEFDGMSLLQRARLDQETFGAFVGAEFVPAHQRWRWRGRKNTARNKLMGILAHVLAAMLFPYVRATNERNEEDKMSARVMAILVEEHLRKAGYETKFLYIVLSALVNPAVFVQVEYVEKMQRVKQRMADGSIKILEAVDEILSGLQINILPIDEVMLADFYTEQLQAQPYIIRVRRIPWDQARAEYGNHPDFKFVQAGMTRIFLTGQESQTLYDIEWTEADRDYVQCINIQYRAEDLEVEWVGGVFMGNPDDVYNSNPIRHRRMQMIGTEWVTVPVYNIAKSGFEPIDPTGRFAYYKSGAFKEYWDDKSQNFVQRMLLDGTALDVMKPIFGTGIAKMDTTVIAPGAFVGMPMGANVTPYQLGPNLAAAYNAVNQAKEDMSDSTQDKIMTGGAEPGVTAYATSQAEQNARVFLGNFGTLLAKLVSDIGELTVDIVVAHTTVGELDQTVPEAMAMKYKTVLAKGKEKGKNVTNRIMFTDKYMGRNMSEEEVKEREWELFEDAGGEDTDQRLYEVNPYQFARNKYSMWVDADQIVSKSMGTDEQRSALALQVMTSPMVAPYVNMENVVEDFAIEPFANGDPERYIKKVDPNDMLNQMMMNPDMAGQALPGVPNQLPTQSTRAGVPM